MSVHKKKNKKEEEEEKKTSSVGETKAAKILWTSHILKSFLSTQTK